MLEFLLAVLIFVIPSNLFVQLVPETAYVHGLHVDYLTARISIQLLVVALVFGASLEAALKSAKTRDELFTQLARTVRQQAVLISLFAILLLRQFFALHPLVAVLSFLEWSVLGLTLLALRQSAVKPRVEKFLRSALFVCSILATLIFQSGLALVQFVTQKSLAGYWLLGEGNMQALSGLSKVVLFGQQWTAPLGTTAHANVLGGVLAVYLLVGGVCIGNRAKQSPPKYIWHGWIGALVLALTALFLTQSISAWLALAVGALAIFGRTFRVNWWLLYGILGIFLAAPLIVHTATFIWPSSDSLLRRDYLNQAAWRMWIDHPLVGVGLQNSTAFVEEYSQVREVARFTQPAHHVGLLALAETGVLGMTAIGVLVAALTHRNWRKQLPIVLSAMILMSLDHYMLTLSTGRFLMLLVLLVWTRTWYDRG